MMSKSVLLEQTLLTWFCGITLRASITRGIPKIKRSFRHFKWVEPCAKELKLWDGKKTNKLIPERNVRGRKR